MKKIHIKLDDELHKRLRLGAAEQALSLQDYVHTKLVEVFGDQVKENSQSRFRFVDLFAGIGGMRIPFQELGGISVFGCDIDKFARQTYYAFFGEALFGDIKTIHPKNIPDFDILLAGFPCQPFSQAGLRNGFSDTRGTLFFEIEKILRAKKPPAILLENVKGLKGHDGGRTMKVIEAALEKSGYQVKSKILAARDFGLPQNRERIYIVGFRSEDAAERFTFPSATGEKTTVGAILERVVDPKYTLSDRLWEGHQRRRLKHAERGNGFGYGLFDHNSSYTNTISARYYKDGSEILIRRRAGNPRRLTPTEAARLQGFPDTIVTKAREAGVSDAQLYKQFGNSVAVNVVRAIAKQMIEALKL